VLVGLTGAVPAGLQVSVRLHPIPSLLFQQISVTILTFVCYSACTFCLSLANTEARFKGKREEVKQPLVNDQSPMGRPTPETGGGKPHHQDHEHFTALKEQGQFDSGDKKLIKPTQQPADPRWESYDRFFRKGPMRPAVFGGHARPSRDRKAEDNHLKPLNYSDEPVDVHTAQLQKEGRLRPDRRKPKEIFRVFYGKPPEGEVPGDASTYLSDPNFRGFAEPMRPAVFGGHVRPNPERKPKGNHPKP
jgi:hypothetical protein